ncbi:MAG: universal stress protein [Ornithinimicrobium sp.]
MSSHIDAGPIVVGYDASGPAVAALHWAGALAAETHAHLVVLFAGQRNVALLDAGYSIWDPADLVEDAKQVAQLGVDDLTSRYPSLQVQAAGSLLPAAMALDEASAGASMVVVGSHGRGRVSSIVLGSTAYGLSGNARCPVVVVRDAAAPRPGAGRPVVVGSDGSATSDRAVDVACTHAMVWAAPLVVLTSWMPPPPDPWDRPPMGYHTVAAAMKDLAEGAQRINDATLQRVRSTHQDLDVTGRVVEARPEDALLTATPDTALVVLGNRGQGVFAGAVLGSTTRSVLHQRTGPVMVVH